MKRSIIARLALAVLASSLALVCGASRAGIILNSTRVIYEGERKEASILVRNAAKDDLAIQAWLESEQGQPIPFAVNPTLSRLDAGKQQLLRIFYQGQGLPADRESMFWLSVQEIPQKAKDGNTLQLAVRQRIKLFYRPADLPGSAHDAPGQLKWMLRGGKNHTQLEVVNNSAFHQTLSDVQIQVGERRYDVVTEMIPPLSSRSFPVPNLALPTTSRAKVLFGIVNDYGGTDRLEALLQDSQAPKYHE